MSALSVKDRQPIGVFDSGLGGLAVLRHFLKELPDRDYLYLGDNARVPYGEKSPETIYNYTREAVEHLFRSGCHLVIIACNTASAQALRRLQQEFLPAWPGRRLLGVIRPLAEQAALDCQKRREKKLGIIGTKATIRSGAYPAELAKLDPEIAVVDRSAPLLVPLIEEGWARKPETRMILKKYLRPLKEAGVNYLLLGCTHYSFLLKEIRRMMGQRVSVPEPGEVIAQRLHDYLDRHPELPVTRFSERRYLATDANESFRRLGEEFMGEPIENLELVNISEPK